MWQVDRMGDVLDFEKPGFITYNDVIDNLILPDKTGFCSQFSDFPLGKSGEVHPHLTKCIDQMVLESQLSQTIVSLLFTISLQYNQLTILRGS